MKVERRHPSLAAGLFLASLAATTAGADRPKALEANNLRLLGHSDLNGHGNGGEGLDLRQYADGRRILFLAHESGPICFSVIDVTRTARPTVVTQVPVVAANIRCNSLGVSNATLVVAQQTAAIGQPYGGVTIYDVADPARPTARAFFDTSGPASRGVHFVWFVDGRYAYLATGARDFVPTHANDDQFLMIVDVGDPSAPREVGRWWLPGTRQGDRELPPPRLAFDGGYRMHSLHMTPQRPDRAYIGWIDGGVVILDLADRSRPKLVARRSWYPPEVGYTHTVVPILERRLLVVSEEAVRDRCEDWPKRLWTVDLADESAPREAAAFPAPKNLRDLCSRGGRFGAHNIHMNRPVPNSRTLTATVVGTFFNGGVRIYSIADPRRPVEIAAFVPAGPPGNATGTIQMNDVYVDEKGSIYANDRLSGGLYILEYTGSVPLR